MSGAGAPVRYVQRTRRLRRHRLSRLPAPGATQHRSRACWKQRWMRLAERAGTCRRRRPDGRRRTCQRSGHCCSACAGAQAADLQRAWNAHLPPAITVRVCSEAPEEFHPRFSAVSRTYRYTVRNAGSEDRRSSAATLTADGSLRLVRGATARRGSDAGSGQALWLARMTLPHLASRRKGDSTVRTVQAARVGW